MSTVNEQYEIVIGLEVHAQLLTQSKLFCGDSIAFGAEPNTHVSPITLAHPGTLPKMNRQAIGHAIKMGLACNCEIEKKKWTYLPFFLELTSSFYEHHNTSLRMPFYLSFNPYKRHYQNKGYITATHHAIIQTLSSYSSGGRTRKV